MMFKRLFEYPYTPLEGYPAESVFRKSIYGLQGLMICLLTFLWLEYTRMDGLFKSVYPLIVGLLVSGSHYLFSEAGARMAARHCRPFRVTVAGYWGISLAGVLFGFSMVWFNAQCPGVEKVYPDIFYFYTDHPDPPARVSVFFKLILLPWLVATVLITQGELKRQLKKELELIRQINTALKEKAPRDDETGALADAGEKPGWFEVTTGDGTKQIPQSSLISISVKDHYCEILFFRDGKSCRELVRLSLKQAKDRLPKSRFEQVHRSHVVNLDHVQKVIKKGQAFQLYMAGSDTPIPASRHRAGEFLPRIGTKGN